MKTDRLAVGMRGVIVAALLLLSSCGPVTQSPTPLPTVMLGGEQAGRVPGLASPQVTEKAGITASAVVVPAQQAQLAFAVSGKVSALNVSVGDPVKNGQTLVTLHATDAELALAQAQAEVVTAQAHSDHLKLTEPIQIAANIALAKVALLDAQNTLAQLERDAPLETARAQLALTNAQKALKDAQTDRTRMDYPRANQSTIETAQAQYELAQDALERAQDAYDQVKNRPADDAERGRALLGLSDAQKERDKALITLNWYLGKNSELDLAEADAQLALAQAQLSAAQARWDDVKDGPSASLLALVQARVTSAQAQLHLAETPSTTQALAQAQLELAHVRLELAQAQLDKMTLVAPFDGIVAALDVGVGEWALAGQAILVVVDLDPLRIETTDLSERDVTGIAPGQQVTVSFKALDEKVTGVVRIIAPLADRLGGDVVYKVTIDLEALPAGLRAGMSAEVQFGSGK